MVRRRLVGRSALLLALLLPAIFHSTGAAVAAARAPLQDFGACVAGGGDARVLLLLDTSASLGTTDPGAGRVDAARHLTDQLGEFARATKAPLNIAVAGFADDFDVALDWTALNSSGERKITKAVDSFRAKDKGWETDYWRALQGARSYLSDGAGPQDCKALVWLTDGMYDLDVRDSKQERDDFGTTKPYAPGLELTSAKSADKAERLGSTDLCRVGGVADALRTDGITTVAIALREKGGAADYSLMSGVATRAKVDEQACGARQPMGSFVLAEDVGDLFFAFDALADPENLPTERTSKLCQGDICPEGTHGFVTDQTIRSASVLGGASVPGFEAVFVAPGGDRHTLRAGETLKVDHPGYSLRASWRAADVFSAKIVRGEASSWAGDWGVVFVDPARSGRGTARSNIRLTSDLSPVWAGQDELVAGDRTGLDLGLALSDGTRVKPADIRGDVRVDVALDRGDSRTVLAEGLDARQLGSAVEVDLTGEGPGEGRLLMEMSLTTASAGGKGTVLPPRSVSYPVTIQAPGKYPRLPSAVDFGRSDSPDPAEATVTWKGGGCVWLESSDVELLPASVTGAKLSSDANSEANCVNDEFGLTLTPAGAGEGLLSGTAMLRALPGSGTGEAVELPLRFRYEMERPANEPLRWAVATLVMLAGLVIPGAVLAGVKWRGATLADDGLAITALRGRVDDELSFLSAASIVRNEQLLLHETMGRRNLGLSDRLQLRTHAYPFLFAKAPAVVGANPQSAGKKPYCVTSNGDTLPLATQGHWVAVLDPDTPHRGDVEVLLLLPLSGVGAEELLAQARAEVPQAVARLRGGIGVADLPESSPSNEESADDSGWYA